MAEDQNFIAHVSCQVLLTRLWMGTMAMNTQWWKVGESHLRGVEKAFGKMIEHTIVDQKKTSL